MYVCLEAAVPSTGLEGVGEMCHYNETNRDYSFELIIMTTNVNYVQASLDCCVCPLAVGFTKLYLRFCLFVRLVLSFVMKMWRKNGDFCLKVR